MTKYQANVTVVKYESDPTDKSEPTELAQPLTYSEGYIARALYFSRMGRGKFPNATTYRSAHLLLRVNTFRLEDGRMPIKLHQLRRIVTSLAYKGYVVFRSNRRRRKPTADAFRRATYIEVMAGGPETLRYLERGRHRGQTHRLPRIQKCPLTVTPQEKSVDGHEETNAPLKKRKIGVGGASADAGNGSQTQETNPKAKPTFQPNVLAAEKELTSLAMTVSDELGTPWEPLAGKRTWRLRGLHHVLGGSPLSDNPELRSMVAGMAYARSRDIERAEKRGNYHEFWGLDEGDILARATAYLCDFNRSDHADRLERVGERVLWNRHREEECRLEAAVGAR